MSLPLKNVNINNLEFVSLACKFERFWHCKACKVCSHLATHPWYFMFSCNIHHDLRQFMVTVNSCINYHESVGYNGIIYEFMVIHRPSQEIWVLFCCVAFFLLHGQVCYTPLVVKSRNCISENYPIVYAFKYILSYEWQTIQKLF